MQDIFYQMLEFNKSGSDELPQVHIIDMPGIQTGMDPHWHEAVEICFVIRNPIVSTVDGKMVQIEEGDFGVINSCGVHRLVALYPDKNSLSLCVIIPYQMFTAICPDFNQYHLVIQAEHPDRTKISQSLEKIYQLKRRMQLFSCEQALINAEIWKVIYWLLEKFRVRNETQTITASKQQDVLAKQAMAYIDEHFREPLTLTEVAQKVGLQENYFCRYFKKYIDMSYGQYLARVRLRYGLSYMLCFNGSVTDSALQAEFSSAKSFIVWCKRIYGVTPAQYKKQQTETEGRETGG